MAPRFGSHMSIAGGLHLAVLRARAVGGEALQLFTKSSNQWAARPLAAEDALAFRAAAAAARLAPVLAHDSYLINVASPDDDLRRRSLDALEEEFVRCAALGVPYLVMHPGAHVGAGEEAGIAAVAEALDELHRRRGPDVMVLLENTAGQGTTLGRTFEQLAAIRGRLEAPERVGVCFDTAHAFAAGCDLATDEGWERTWRAFAAVLGQDRLRALHVNDSKKGLGSRVDRHEQIGLGELGPSAFWRLANDPRFDGLPAVLETEKEEDLADDARKLFVLRRLGGLAAPPSRAEVESWRAEAPLPETVPGAPKRGAGGRR